MLTSKEAKNNANNHSLQACQSGTGNRYHSITGRYQQMSEQYATGFIAYAMEKSENMDADNAGSEL
ncbi:hypothetical protein FORC31_p285 (plasmid) [Escherichia coli]|nr:hypothetical protein FORC31_p285 [Escherichia coli]